MAPTKIYITSLAKAMPGKRPLQAIAMPVMTLPEAKPVLYDAAVPPRKRQRLTHLSPEEKLMRRKLKNRVAAQTARDRKKEHMDGLEDRLTLLEEQAAKLLEENEEIKEENAGLIAENNELKRRLGLEESEIRTPQMTKVGTVMTVKKESKSTESAAGTGLGPLNIPNSPNDFESDVLLGLLDGLQEQISAKSDDGPITASQLGHRLQIGQKIHTPLVGPTAEELESLKELIKFDHEYVKKPSELAKQTLNVVTTCSDKFATELTNNRVKTDTDVLMTPEILISMDTPDLVPSLLESAAGTFDCDISDLLSFDLNNCDSKSESGLSESGSSDSAFGDMPRSPSGSGDSAFGDMPRSPFSDDASMSPGLGDGMWEESFTQLFPSLEDLC